MQKSKQVPSKIVYTRSFASVHFRAKSKRIRAFCCSAAIQKTRVFCAQGAHDKYCRQDLVAWHINSKSLLKELDVIECQNTNENLMERIALNSIKIHKIALSLVFID